MNFGVSPEDTLAWAKALMDASKDGSVDQARAVISHPNVLQLALSVIFNQDQMPGEMNIDRVFLLLNRIGTPPPNPPIDLQCVHALRDLVIHYTNNPVEIRLWPLLSYTTNYMTARISSSDDFRRVQYELFGHCINILSRNDDPARLEIGLRLAGDMLASTVERKFIAAVLVQCRRFFNRDTFPSMFSIGPAVIGFCARSCSYFPDLVCGNEYINQMLVDIMVLLKERPALFKQDKGDSLVRESVNLLDCMLSMIVRLGDHLLAQFTDTMFPICVNACMSIVHCFKAEHDDIVHKMMYCLFNMHKYTGRTLLSSPQYCPCIIRIALYAMSIVNDDVDDRLNPHNAYNNKYSTGMKCSARTTGLMLLCSATSAENVHDVMKFLIDTGQNGFVEEIMYSFLKMKSILTEINQVVIDGFAPIIVRLCLGTFMRDPRQVVKITALRVLARYSKWLEEEQVRLVYTAARDWLTKCDGDLATMTVLFETILWLSRGSGMTPCEQVVRIFQERRGDVVTHIDVKLESLIVSKMNDGGASANWLVRKYIHMFVTPLLENQDIDFDAGLSGFLELISRELCWHLSNPAVVLPVHEIIRLFEHMIACRHDCDTERFVSLLKEVLECVIVRATDDQAAHVIGALCRWIIERHLDSVWVTDISRILTVFIGKHRNCWNDCCKLLWDVMINMFRGTRLNEWNEMDILSIGKLFSAVIQTGRLSPELLHQAWGIAWEILVSATDGENAAEIAALEMFMSIAAVCNAVPGTKEIVSIWDKNLKSGYFGLPYFRRLCLAFLPNITNNNPRFISAVILQELMLNQIPLNELILKNDMYSWNARSDDYRMPIDQTNDPDGFVR